jgi:hypothetical protein
MGDLVRRLRCEKCGAKPIEVYLIEHESRQPKYGEVHGWSVQLV